MLFNKRLLIAPATVVTSLLMVACGGSGGGGGGGGGADTTAPDFGTSPTTYSVQENGTVVGTVTASDGGTITFSITGGADAAAFAIGAASGVLSFTVAPDFETPGDSNADNVYTVVITATDDSGNTSTLTINVTVTNDPADDGGGPTNNAPEFASPTASLSVDENTIAVGNASATDSDGDTLTYTLSGPDAGAFNIDSGTGAITFNPAPDFESPTDTGADNDYNVTITADDGTDTDSQDLTITVNDVTESGGLPSFDGPTTVSDPGPVVSLDPDASDPDGDTLDFTYTYGGGPIDLPNGFDLDDVHTPTTGTGATDLTFPVNGTYTINVTADDGNGNSTTHTITVTVSNPTPITISGQVEDTVSGSTSGTSGLDVELQWKPLSDAVILVDPTNGSGDFSFDDLLGSADDFKVMVPGS